MPHQITRGYGIQKVPDDFTTQINQLKADQSPLLNPVLVTARRLNWSTQTLAAALDIPMTAASKRMERATPTPWAVHMREIAGLTARDYDALIDKNPADYVLIKNEDVILLTDDLGYLIEARVGQGDVSHEDVLAVSATARERLQAQAAVFREQNTPATRKIAKQLTTLTRRLERAESYVPPPEPALIDASAADDRWLEHMAECLVSARRDLNRLPEFEADHPELRRRISNNLHHLWSQASDRRVSAEDASTASARIREEIQILKKAVSKAQSNRASIVRKLTTIANQLRLAEEHTGGPVWVGLPGWPEKPDPARLAELWNSRYPAGTAADLLDGTASIPVLTAGDAEFTIVPDENSEAAENAEAEVAVDWPFVALQADPDPDWIIEVWNARHPIGVAVPFRQGGALRSVVTASAAYLDPFGRPVVDLKSWPTPVPLRRDPAAPAEVSESYVSLGSWPETVWLGTDPGLYASGAGNTAGVPAKVVGGDRPPIIGLEVPVPPRMQTMLHGESLDEETISQLRNLQSVASVVNGGTAPDSAHWRASRKLSELLWELNNPKSEDGVRYTAYYLAKVMGITHHAVITRLRRYQNQMEKQRTSMARRNARRSSSAA